jgi:hypothetical protein
MDRPVISKADRTRVGMAREILVDAARNVVVGFVLDLPISIGQARVVLATDASYSDHTVLVDNVERVKYVGEIPELKPLIECGVGMAASPVTVGHDQVPLAEFAFDPATHQIVGRSVGGEIVPDTLEGKAIKLATRPVEEYDGPGWDSYARYVYDLDYSSLGL